MYETNESDSAGLSRVGRQAMSLKESNAGRTIGQNIDARIAGLKVEIERLQGVRKQLENGASLLDVRIEDLRQAMNY